MAISKERLIKLIEQGATIWHDDWEEIKLDKNTCEICEVKSITGEHISWCLYFEYEWSGTKQHTNIDIEELEEDVESAKWHYEMKRARAEYFDPPTWEEFKVIGGFAFYDYNHNLISMKICLDPVNVAPCNDCIYIADSKNEYFCKPKTKENYIKACEYARSLFLGE